MQPMILKNSLRLYSGGTQRVRDHSTEIKENFKENLGRNLWRNFLTSRGVGVAFAKLPLGWFSALF
jgi:hypothetical protein